MLPNSAIVRACLTWVGLLRTSTVAQSWLILRAAPEYADLTQGQYHFALELLKNIGVLANGLQSWILSEQFRHMPERQIRRIMFERLLELSAPAWLPDSDILIPDPSEIPADAEDMAAALQLGDADSFDAIQNVHARLDLLRRKEIGDAGELGLLRFLEANWPGSTVHVARISDGFGYDIAFSHGETEWHFEVKSTIRRGRLNVYVSRNEFDKSLRDPYWRLIVVGLDQSLALSAIATLRLETFHSSAPGDKSSNAKWQSAAFEFTEKNLMRGICLDENRPECSLIQSASASCGADCIQFGWLPCAYA